MDERDRRHRAAPGSKPDTGSTAEGDAESAADADTAREAEAHAGREDEADAGPTADTGREDEADAGPTADTGREDGAAPVEEGLQLPMPVLAVSDALDLLAYGDLEVVGRLWVSTNNALLCLARRRCPDPEPDLVAACIYKPIAGERPLDDFPHRTLGRREVAAFEVSEASGWGIVPPTALRDGPYGEGMVQLWIAADPEADPVAMVVGSDPRLRPVAVFDAVVNNTDRKAGHLLPVPGGHVYGVDHGVTFSPIPKLRTVLWNWRGQALAPDEVAVLRELRSDLDGDLGSTLRELLDPIEVRATARRIDRLLDAGVFPQPDPRRPALPWPPV